MKIIKKILVVVILLIQIILQIPGASIATINEGEELLLQRDHECTNLLEYWMEDYQKWSYKVIWYIYYEDKDTNERFPAFCVEPEKQGIGITYTEYDTTLSKGTDDAIWRILNKGYMGTTYDSWDLECDDDLYSATKVAIHSYIQQADPVDKYIVGTRSVDGIPLEEIQRRAPRVLEVAQSLYEYAINGTEGYVEPKIKINKVDNYTIEKINGIEYYVQNYKVNSNKSLKSYEISITNFPNEAKIINSNNNSFKIAIPIKYLKTIINGQIYINNAKVKTNPVYHCASNNPENQSYVTYTTGYEVATTNTTLYVDPNNCDLLIKKIDSNTKKPIPEVVFEITNEKGEKLGEYETNEKGEINLKELPPQILKIQEVATNEKYEIDNEVKTVKLEWGKTSKIEVENERIKGKIEITKTSEDDNEITNVKAGSFLPDVKFEIYDEENKLIETIITDAKGVATTKELERGIYTIKEVKTLEEYILNEKEIKVEILKNNETVKINITNKSKEVEKLPKTGF